MFDISNKRANSDFSSLSDVLRDSAAAPATPAQGVTGLVPGAQGVTGALPTQQLLGGLQGKAISGVLPVHRDLLPKI